MQNKDAWRQRSTGEPKMLNGTKVVIKINRFFPHTHTHTQPTQPNYLLHNVMHLANTRLYDTEFDERKPNTHVKEKPKQPQPKPKPTNP